MGWFNVIGLAFDLFGAVFLAWDLMISNKEAIELGVSRWAGDNDNENIKLPAVQDRIKQSKNAKIGLFILAIGFLLQIIGSWPRWQSYA